jgi:hypothetical protein
MDFECTGVDTGTEIFIAVKDTNKSATEEFIARTKKQMSNTKTDNNNQLIKHLKRNTLNPSAIKKQIALAADTAGSKQ